MSIEGDLEMAETAREVGEFLDEVEMKLFEKSVQTPVLIDCGRITGPMYPDRERQRCTIKRTDHRGPHWSQTEPVPPDCTCKYFCNGHRGATHA